MHERASDSASKDAKITKLEKNITHMRRTAIEHASQEQKSQEQIKHWKQRWQDESTEKEFYHKSALETKKKNKLLKVAVSRLQHEYD
jgi:hypothetical protein